MIFLYWEKIKKFIPAFQSRHPFLLSYSCNLKINREKERYVSLSLSPLFISSLHLREIGLSKIVWLAWLEGEIQMEWQKVYNETQMTDEWMDLHFKQSFGNRNSKVKLYDDSRVKIGKNILSKRLTTINNMIEYDWLNTSYNCYKVKCKGIFLSQQQRIAKIFHVLRILSLM